MANNLGCPAPALDIAAIGKVDGSLTFYAIVASSPNPLLMMKPEQGGRGVRLARDPHRTFALELAL